MMCIYSTHVLQNHANPGTLGRLVRITFVERYLMSTNYHAIAGQSLERLAALSDGVFAIAMTLLVLDLRVPVSTGIQFERDLWRALVSLAPHLVPYGLSFMTLGIFWIGQQTQLSSFAQSNRTLTWIHLDSPSPHQTSNRASQSHSPGKM